MNGTEKITISKNSITLNKCCTIMHAGEDDLMKKLAEITTQNGGDILEIGFGMHISADYIQSNPNIKSHTIIEVHPEIYKTALDWVKDKPNTQIILGDWVDVIPTLNKKFDGILHDTYNEKNFSIILDVMSTICKKGSILSFFTYPKFDHRFNGVRVSLDMESFESLPYKNIVPHKLNQYELLYTTFDGNKFYREISTTHLL